MDKERAKQPGQIPVDTLRALIKAQDAVSEGLNLEITPPSAAARRRGVVAHFAYPAEEGWRAGGDVSTSSNGLVISRLEVWPGGDGSQSVTAGILRQVPVGAIVATVRAHATFEAAQGEATRAAGLGEPMPKTLGGAADTPQRRGGRAPLSDELIADVAVAYLEETLPGKGSGATKRLAERFERPEETVRAWVARARRDGWLGPGSKGRPGAAPGPRLLQSGRLHEGK